MADSTSEADISEEPSNNSSKSSEQKKKERIRDNQRRSRARRQEHLADLERRLAACHNTVREAEMQRTAFRDAQIENSRLRSLLKVAGVDENLTQSYINQGISQAQNTDSNHRTIRPRMPVHQDGTRSEIMRDESSTRASPFSEISATLESEPTHASFHLSSNFLASDFPSPASQPILMASYPMTSHTLQDTHMQYESIFQPEAPLPNESLCYSAAQGASDSSH